MEQLNTEKFFRVNTMTVGVANEFIKLSRSPGPGKTNVTVDF